MSTSPRIVPELDVADLDESIEFYVGTCGFEIRYRRDAEQFVYLDLAGAELMLQAASGPGRRFRTAPLEHPFGRGINLQIRIDDVEAIHARLTARGHQLVVPIEERWYRTDRGEVGQRQLVVADPDGYLLRLFTELGPRAQLDAAASCQPAIPEHRRSRP